MQFFAAALQIPAISRERVYPLYYVIYIPQLMYFLCLFVYLLTLNPQHLPIKTLELMLSSQALIFYQTMPNNS